MKMTPEAFHTWCQHLGLTSETEALLASIRSSPPIRRVKSRAGNTHELRNEIVEEFIADRVSESCAEPDAPLVRGGRTRGMESEKGSR